MQELPSFLREHHCVRGARQEHASILISYVCNRLLSLTASLLHYTSDILELKTSRLNSVILNVGRKSGRWIQTRLAARHLRSLTSPHAFTVLSLRFSFLLSLT